MCGLTLDKAYMHICFVYGINLTAGRLWRCLAFNFGISLNANKRIYVNFFLVSDENIFVDLVNQKRWEFKKDKFSICKHAFFLDR